MTDLNQNVPETFEDEDRRKFLATCGRFAVVTPPAITILLSTSLTSTAIARSGGSVGYSSGDKHSFIDDLFDNGPDDPPQGSGMGNGGQGRFSGGGGAGGSDGPSLAGSRSGGGGYSDSQTGWAGGSSRSSGMGRGDEDDKSRKGKDHPEERRADR